ncbi:PLDc N-terminal domain-containing protein [Vallitalea pronyensis]|uniref:PLDc N-terminal domain-containing protein n=1 Tax=Vallitalea pronyensis TaxID=1348613 RepID=A0A8J8MP59_9FIRM|nr:PLDc N-terminal domain-containing protein [Vallitalea pronyensis]QUI24818.1 PLDc N-terminal domain-containing protein [Vallitalea pronyensis]
MEQFIDYLPLFIPILIIQLTLAIIALVHVLKHPNYRFGNKYFWIIIVLLVQIIGPVFYFILGRGDA